MLGGRRVVKEIGPSRNRNSNNNNSNSNSNSNSNNNNGNSGSITPSRYSHMAAMSRNILSNIEQGPELDFSDDFEDSRLELKSTGTIISIITTTIYLILINLIGHNLTSVLINPRETMLDSIMDEFELDQSLPLDLSPLTSPNPYQAYSPLISNSNNSIGESLLLFPPTSSSDIESLTQVINRMKRIYSEYVHVHNNDNSINSKYKNIRMDCSSVRTAEDLATCFQIVPVNHHHHHCY